MTTDIKEIIPFKSESEKIQELAIKLVFQRMNILDHLTKTAKECVEAAKVIIRESSKP